MRAMDLRAGCVAGAAALLLLGPSDGRASVDGGGRAYLSDVAAEASGVSVVTGRVQHQDGTPARGARVTALGVGGTATTGPGGRFEIETRSCVEAGRDVAVVAKLDRGGHRWIAEGSASWGAEGVHEAGVLTLRGGDCEPGWAIGVFDEDGVNGRVYAMRVFDDGSGPALYLGGAFDGASSLPGTSRLVRWDGMRWSSVDGGLDGDVRALEVFDDWEGPALYVGGEFGVAGSTDASNLARWDGETWSEVGGGTDGPVRALGVFDDGGGPALYVGGEFTRAGSVDVGYAARWDGASWSGLAEGFDARVSAFGVFDDGAGSALYVGGDFERAGSADASRIARWDGGALSALGNGVSDEVLALLVYDDGLGDALYVGGRFSQAGGDPASGIALWDGEAWMAVGEGVAGFQHAVRDMAVVEDGGRSVLVVGGRFDDAGGLRSRHVAQWDGEGWSPMGPGFSIVPTTTVHALAMFDDGRQGPRLFAGGFIQGSGERTTFNNVSRWEDGAWWPVGGGGLDGPVHAMAVFDDGRGEALYVGGGFDFVGGVRAEGIARWDGANWSQVGDEIVGLVLSMLVHDDGTAPALYVGGGFGSTRDGNIRNIGKWDGEAWHPLETGIGHGGSFVHSMETFDEGIGPRLFAGGRFSQAGGTSAGNIARWDGVWWRRMGNNATVGFAVHDMATFDDGSDTALYIAGDLTIAGPLQVNRIASWDGVSWSDVGGGLTGTGAFVDALVVHQDGSGPALYAGGAFEAAGGTPASNIARWDGAGWSPVGDGIPTIGSHDRVSALGVYDQGDGPQLYAAGLFEAAGSVSASNIARWTGSEWLALDEGLDDHGLSMAVFDDGRGASLYVGGRFDTVGGTPSRNLARWDGCPPCIADWNGDGEVDIDDLFAYLDDFADGDSRADLNNDGEIDINDFFIFLQEFEAGC